MYTWFIDYIYIGVIAFMLLFAPLIVWFLDKKIFGKPLKIRIIFLSLIFICVMIVSLLWLKSFHIDVIRNICFEWPTFGYKESGIPLGCYDFDNRKYMGIGWPLTAMFWMAFSAIYLTIVYIGWVLVEFFSKKTSQ